MPTEEPVNLALSDAAARQLANATKTTAQLDTITPRWLTRLLQWVPVEAGIYRLNRVKHPEDVEIACPPRDESELPQTYVELRGVAAGVLPQLGIDRRRHPHQGLRPVQQPVRPDRRAAPADHRDDQGAAGKRADQQRRITACSPTSLTCSASPPVTGPPTPDDLDELITKVWKEPAFFLTHPAAIAAFGRECTRRGVPPATVSLFGSQFITWRGVPVIPSDKVPLDDGKTKVLLLRVGEQRQGVVGLFQPGLAGERGAGAVGAVHGHQPQRHRVVPDLVVLLARGAHPGRARGPRRRRGRQVP